MSCSIYRTAAWLAAICLFALPGLAMGGDSGGRIALGEKLFNDTRLSADGRISCASCHVPALAFADGRAHATGVGDLKGTRNTPSLLDAGSRRSLFWDGRREGLETAVLDPLLGSHEHGLRDAADLTQRVKADRGYRSDFKRAFGRSAVVDAAHVTQALAAYVRTLRSGVSAFDRNAFRKDEAALTSTQRAGYSLFRGRAGCTKCHLIEADSAALTDERFHYQGIDERRLRENLTSLVQRASAVEPSAIGLAIQADPEVAALGRYLVTRNTADIGAFRTPSLRNVARTAPYMHDGSIATLREAVDHELYYAAADRGAGFSHEERDALVAFLEALTGDESGSEDSPATAPR